MPQAQPGILAPVPAHARYLFFATLGTGSPAACLRALGDLVDGDRTVVGLGPSLVDALGRQIPGLRNLPRFAGARVEVPSTPEALWCWLRGDDRGELLHRSRSIARLLAPAFRLSRTLDAFKYGAGLDLTGFEDGTENPKGEAAIAAAVAAGMSPALDGGSFVAVQVWLHDLDAFERLSATQQDNVVGRHRIGNAEIADAPASAHVKRTAQESFEPEAFVLRRSMPWSGERGAGLVFVAFGKSFDAFEAQLRRMVGAEDGITDALFTVSRPVTGAYFWCPPTKNGRLDLSAIDTQTT
jgi:putative iron-dependent peroxidase